MCIWLNSIRDCCWCLLVLPKVFMIMTTGMTSLLLQRFILGTLCSHEESFGGPIAAWKGYTFKALETQTAIVNVQGFLMWVLLFLWEQAILPKMLAFLCSINVRLMRGEAWGHERRKKSLTTACHHPQIPEFLKAYLR